MPVFPKRRFQHGAVPADVLHIRLAPRLGGTAEAMYRRQFLALYA